MSELTLIRKTRGRSQVHGHRRAPDGFRWVARRLKAKNAHNQTYRWHLARELEGTISTEHP